MLQIQLQPDPTTHDIKTGDTLEQLEALDLLDIPFGCHDGHCAACMIHVIEGANLLNAPQPVERYTLTRQEIQQGIRLACRTTITGEEGIVVLKVHY